MQFLDEVVVFVSSGKGGDGHVSFRREKFIPRGGPDGGDGGDGGAVIFEATPRRNTLVDYHRKRHHRADAGVPGGKRQMYGANGSDLLCPVPVGTIIHDADTDERLADLDVPGARWVLPGGRGGLGNMHFKTSTNRAPRKSTPGQPGEERTLRLELKLLADVGLLGFPNAGKSTFLGRVSAAHPRVADYPFTTLVPQLGVVEVGDSRTFVLADIPGLVEGAADGVGLGIQFLRHVERCELLIHLVSAEPWEGGADPVDKVQALQAELVAHGAGLEATPQVVALNKVDLLDDEARAAQLKALQVATGSKVFPISAATGEGVPALIDAVWRVLSARRPQPVDDDDGA